MLAQMGDRLAAQAWRRSAKRHQAQDAAGAHDMANLLGIMELREKIAGEEGFGRGVHSAGAAFPPDPNPRRKRLDLTALGEIERRDVFPASLSAQAEPAEATGVQQRPEQVHAGSRGGGEGNRRKGTGGGGDHHGELPIHFDRGGSHAKTRKSTIRDSPTSPQRTAPANISNPSDFKVQRFGVTSVCPRAKGDQPMLKNRQDGLVGLHGTVLLLLVAAAFLGSLLLVQGQGWIHFYSEV